MNEQEINKRQIMDEVTEIAAAIVHSWDVVSNELRPATFADYDWKHRYDHDAKFHAKAASLAHAIFDYIDTKLQYPDKSYDEVLRKRHEKAQLTMYLSINPVSPQSPERKPE